MAGENKFYTIQVDWTYKTSIDTTYKGIVILQHGFMRSPSNLKDLSKTIAEENYVVLTPALTILQMNDAGNFVARLNEYIINGLKSNTLLPSLLTGKVDLKIILAGHSAGSQLVSRLANFLLYEPLLKVSGVIYLDPVQEFSSITKSTSSILNHGTPVYSIVGQPSICNRKLESVSSVIKNEVLKHQNFAGIQLRDGTHCTPEGNSTSTLCTTFCGKSSYITNEIFKKFTVGWIEGLILENPKFNASYVPNGDYFLLLQYQGIITPLTHKVY